MFLQAARQEILASKAQGRGRPGPAVSRAEVVQRSYFNVQTPFGGAKDKNDGPSPPSYTGNAVQRSSIEVSVPMYEGNAAKVQSLPTTAGAADKPGAEMSPEEAESGYSEAAESENYPEMPE